MIQPALRLFGNNGVRSIKLQPGERLTIGRHSTYRLALTDPSVSRFTRASPGTPPRGAPWSRTSGARTGPASTACEVSGRVPLRDGGVLELGDVTLAIDLDENVDAALLTESQDGSTSGCRLYSENGSEPRGVVATREALVDLLLELEAGRRTGTLSLDRAARHRAADLRAGPDRARDDRRALRCGGVSRGAGEHGRRPLHVPRRHRAAREHPVALRPRRARAGRAGHRGPAEPLLEEEAVAA